MILLLVPLAVTAGCVAAWSPRGYSRVDVLGPTIAHLPRRRALGIAALHLLAHAAGGAAAGSTLAVLGALLLPAGLSPALGARLLAAPGPSSPWRFSRQRPVGGRRSRGTSHPACSVLDRRSRVRCGASHSASV